MTKQEYLYCKKCGWEHEMAAMQNVCPDCGNKGLNITRDLRKDTDKEREALDILEMGSPSEIRDWMRTGFHNVKHLESFIILVNRYDRCLKELHIALETIDSLQNKLRAEKEELVREVARNKTLTAELKRDRNLEIDGQSAWRWAGDGEDHLESMGNDVAVLIRAEDLRALLEPKSKPIPWTSYLCAMCGESSWKEKRKLKKEISQLKETIKKLEMTEKKETK